MPTRQLDPHNLCHHEDWEGNNVAFMCPCCGKVFIVSASRVHRGLRKCPNCGKSTGRCTGPGGRKSGGKASIEW